MPVSAVKQESFTPRAVQVLERACERYGGVSAWRRIRCIRLVPNALRGLVPWLKGSGRSFGLPSAFEIDPHQNMTRFIDYPAAGLVGIFEKGGVRIEAPSGETLVAEDRQYRRQFRGWKLHRRWSACDALYFFGYALAHYHALPFTLLDSRLVRHWVKGHGDDALDVLAMELPADLATHSRHQSFYFDRQSRLVRHDYHAEIVSFWARGAHFWQRESRCNGFPVCMERRVLARWRSRALPVLALHASFREASVEYARDPAVSALMNGC